MKKLIVLILLLITSSCELIYAQSNGGKPKIVLTPFPGTSSDPTGLTESMPLIEAEYNQSELTLSTFCYSGYTDVFIFKTLGHNVMYDNMVYLSETVPVDIDISSYSVGTYTIIVTLDTGEMFQGIFEIE